MTSKSYKASWARIGNASGYRLPSAFFKENPEFVGADGTVQVIAPDTVIFSRTSTEDDNNEEDELILGLFLDFLTQQALIEADSLEPYTQTEADEDDLLMEGVVLDED